MSSDNNYAFFAMLDRMKYINRWGLMRNSSYENIKEHSFDVAVIAHALCVINNEIIAKEDREFVLDPYKVQAIALYHDCTEIITGDLPTPIKYRNDEIKNAYKEVEYEAAVMLTNLLPEELKNIYLKLLAPEFVTDEEIFAKKIIKAADRISAYLKCITEEQSGNVEFSSAKETIKKSIDDIDIPAVKYFMDKFVLSYGMTLDEISGGNNAH